MNSNSIRKIFELKKAGFKTIKKHYFILTAICFLAAYFGVEFASSYTFTTGPTTAISDVYELSQVVKSGNFEEINNKMHKQLEETKETTKNNVFSRNKGVISYIINSASNGMIFYSIMQTINSVTGSTNTSFMILFVFFFTVYLLLWYFIFNTIPVVIRRVSLEARQYEKVSFRKYLFLFKTKELSNVAEAMFRKFIYLVLWGVTIIMPLIKMYSYKMVEYILAENPCIKPKDAINLSKKMMHGYKRKAFLLDLSFLHLEILSLFTLGIPKILFINAYKTATNTEFYYDVRKHAIENKVEGYELLNDKYLYEYAKKDEIQSKYGGFKKIVEENLEPVIKRKGVIGFIENNFGVTFESKEYNKKLNKIQYQEYIKEIYEGLISGKTYPNKLCPTFISERDNNADYLKRYSLVNLIMIFFIIAIFGYVWEVNLIYIQTGIIANRGAMMGPWLPIYGTGSVLALLLGYKLRKRPLIEFLFIVLICGILEYMTSYVMEISTGLRWWDYTGSFLNINGRICLEGLLTFGIGGSTIVYLIAPFLDKKLSKIKMQIIIPIAITLTLLFAVDAVYSQFYPNIGDGITSEVIKTNRFLNNS